MVEYRFVRERHCKQAQGDVKREKASEYYAHEPETLQLMRQGGAPVPTSGTKHRAFYIEWSR